MNVLRSLLYGKQVSLTVANTTAIVDEGIRLHSLSPASAYAYGKAMSALTFMSACLKEQAGEISISAQCEDGSDIGASGNSKLFLRGYISNGNAEGGADEQSERRILGKNGSFTVIRDDGYSRPFVGACAFPQDGNFDKILEEYYRVSEQLPTRIATVVEINEQGRCAFAGVLALQPLPFATEETLEKVAATDAYALLRKLKGNAVADFVRKYFQADESVFEERSAIYKCNCSREYLAGVLVTLGEAQMRDIIATEGAVRAHCHYCNSDYEFTDEDADKLFAKKV